MTLRSHHGAMRWVAVLALVGAASAHAQDEGGTDSDLVLQSIDPEIARQIQEGLRPEYVPELTEEALRGMREGDIPAETPEAPMLRSLPGDAEASAATAQHISLPQAEGSVEGMGESFSPVLSAGTGTYSVPIAVPAGRAGVQPSLALSYSSSGGNGSVGFGWGFGVPFISRQTDRGLPRYRDRAGWHREEDRFIYNGGQELVPVGAADVLPLDDGLGPSAGLETWQQYRARNEGGFMRFYRSTSSRRWIVEGPDGSRLEFGEVPSAELPSDFGVLPNGENASASSLESEEPHGEGRIFRWHLTKMSDAHGSTVYYRYLEDEGSRYLSDVHYVSPASCAAGGDYVAQRNCDEPLSDYGRRVRFHYAARQDVFDSYVPGWRVSTRLRLVRIGVSAAQGAPGSRSMVRRYHLGYLAGSFHSLLETVQVEGRPHALDGSAGAVVASAEIPSEAAMDASTTPLGPLLPPLTFGYSSTRPSTSTIAGFGGLDATVHTSPASPTHSVDEAVSDFFDVNSDGLPDLIVTNPARYRTASGAPAVGVFFNGFSGTGTAPAAAGTFSRAVSVAVPPHLSDVMDLSNSNVVPMDIDGDGRSDLLHMPRRANYGYFIATRNDNANAVRPASQGWEFSHVPVALERGVTDPRLDLSRDGAHMRAIDVNNDHLIDIVRTTGTVMQTWLNLGWLPGGNGRFGSYTYDEAADEYVLSTAPYESCLLHSGTPIDFEDREVQLADMNGDGIQDIVQIRRGFVRYWPGRGLGLWGEGPASCPRGEGANRYIEMATPPTEVNTELAGVYLQDVNHDGAADVVQVRFDAVDVWFNEAGHGFTPRIIARGTPAAPSFAPRVRFVDIDGSGTVDIVFGNADRYQWIDPMGGLRPRLLTRVTNGLGALTTLEYGSSATEYLRDLAEAERCSPSDVTCDRFAWNHPRPCDGVLGTQPGAVCEYRSGGSPVISTVVTAVSTSDQFHRLGREENVSRTEYRYHDGYYEGIEQEFRGFGAADAISLATEHDTHPTGATRTWFHQGRRPNEIASDRLADNPYEPLKGREYQTESWDPESGQYLSTTHSTYAVREMLVGLDDRAIRYAYVSRTDDLRYNVAMGPGSEGTIELPSVAWQSASAWAEVGTWEAPPADSAADPDHLVSRRGLGTILIRSETQLVDNRGHVLLAAALGRPGVDQQIDQYSEPLRVDGRWLWRQWASMVHGAGDVEIYGYTFHDYTDNGDLLNTRSLASMPSTLPSGYQFLGDANGAVGLTQGTQNLDTSSLYDSWGNPTASCVGQNLTTTGTGLNCHRYGQVVYDDDYAQFPETERLAYDRSGGALLYLETEGVWDRGLGVLTSVTDPTDKVTTVGYDGFGRVSYVRAPAAGHSGGSACASNTVPVQHFIYELAVDGLPVSVVRAYAENDCGMIGADQIETRTYVDGLGRSRATLSPGSTSAACDGGGAWVQSGVTYFNARGTVRRAYQNEWITDAEPSPRRAVQRPSVPYEWSTYDAFARPRCAVSACGNMTCTTYHALTTDVCDPLDMTPGSIFTDTCTTTRNDGHGRAIDQVLRNVPAQGGAMEFYRLWTQYRADGAVIKLTRAQTTTDSSTTVVDGRQVERTFTYDSMGRRIGTTDPDSDSTDPGRTARNRTWRYLYNEAGDLVAVRDPRGCGQNFYYDRLGRLIGEDYVECGEIQSAGDTPSETVPATSVLLAEIGAPKAVDVRYFYDAPPTWASGYSDVMASDYEGRLAGVSDRGQRSAMAYDARGQVVWAARQMVVIGEAPSVTMTNANTANGVPPVVSEGAVAPAARVYDDEPDHTYVRTARYDYGGRPRSMVLPTDPDWETFGGTGTAPAIGGTLEYDERGLPSRVALAIDDVEERAIVEDLHYNANGLVCRVVYGDNTAVGGGSRTPTFSETTYDHCLRPETFHTERVATSYGGLDPRPLALVTTPMSQRLVWDAASNLVEVADLRDGDEWPDGYRPQSVNVGHDALYRVSWAEYAYTQDMMGTGPDSAQDWRADQATTRSGDPMRTTPAAMVPTLPAERVNDLEWTYDWLGNMQEWNDDAESFYERSIGDIENGADRATPERPAALHLATNIRRAASAPTEIDVGVDRGGWVELTYGEDGNVVAMTVHGQCKDASSITACYDDEDLEGTARASELRAGCVCAVEQHYQYRWDELNRLAEARRFDRAGGADWTFEVRQRYRYDSGNQRTVKQTIATSGPDPERIALYVYPGDWERRGLVRGLYGDAYDASTGLDSETQYMVGGARVVWKHGDAIAGLDRDQRVTVPLTDLIQTTAAVLDLNSGELLEASTYYPNGARESMRVQDQVAIAGEPSGFTGKEADEEVGVVYFGERYLIARVGRWASPDPLQVHAVGGGEAMNGYHYVAGNLMQARDPLGLWPDTNFTVEAEAAGVPPIERTPQQIAIDAARDRLAPLIAMYAASRWNADRYNAFSVSPSQVEEDPGEAEGMMVRWDARSERWVPTIARPRFEDRIDGIAFDRGVQYWRTTQEAKDIIAYIAIAISGVAAEGIAAGARPLVRRGMSGLAVLLGDEAGGASGPLRALLARAAQPYKLAFDNPRLPPHQRFQCRSAAYDMMQALDAHGVEGAQVIHLRYRGVGRITHDTVGGRPIEATGEHWAVQVGDEVFDNIHPNGIPRAEWEAGFQTMEGGFSESFSGQSGSVTIETSLPPE